MENCTKTLSNTQTMLAYVNQMITPQSYHHWVDSIQSMIPVLVVNDDNGGDKGDCYLSPQCLTSVIPCLCYSQLSRSPQGDIFTLLL